MRIEKLHNNRITLINGDCLEVMPKIKPNSIDMVFADLPYGTTRNKWDSVIPLDTLWQQLHTCGKSTTPYVFSANNGFQFTLGASNIKEYRYDWCWDKCIPSGMAYARYQPMRQHESILVFYQEVAVYNPQMSKRDKPIKSGGQKQLNSGTTELDEYKTEDFTRTYDEKNPTTILSFMKMRRGSIHPTQKPVELLEYLIRTYTNENDVVLDPTAGSFTTAVACINTNRRCIAIEKDTELGYFEASLKRCIDASVMKEHSNVI